MTSQEPRSNGRIDIALWRPYLDAFDESIQASLTDDGDPAHQDRHEVFLVILAAVRGIP